MSETLGELIVKLGLDANPFQSGIKSINSQMKTSESQFKAFGKSAQNSTKNLDFLKTKSDALSKSIGLQNQKIEIYTKELDKSKQRVTDLATTQDKLKQKVDGASKAYEQSVQIRGKDDKVTQQIKENYNQLNKELGNNEQMLQKAGQAYDNKVRAVNGAKGALKDLESELERTDKALSRLQNSTYQAGLKMQEYGDKAIATGKKIKSVGDGIAGVGKTLTLGLTTPLIGIGAAAFKASTDFETAFMGVTKTIDMTAQETEEMRKSIVDMSNELPHTKENISEVAQAAGQLGIQKQNVMDFTEVMLNMGVATDLSATQSADSMARFANITQMSQGDFERLGSTVVDLGNNFATTESEIVNMGLRLAGAGTQIGLSEAQIMGFATALSSVGIQAEAGGSAFSKVMKEMQIAVETNSEKLVNFAEVANMSAEEFASAWKKDPAEALSAFIQGLGDTEKAGKSTILMLNELGITEVRTSDVMTRLSGNSNLVTNALSTANKAWKDNNALQNEASKFNDTNANKLLVMKNRINSVAVEIGDDLTPKIVELGNKGVNKLTEYWRGLSKEQKENIVTIGAHVAAIGPLLLVGGKVISGIGSTVSTIGTLSKSIGGVITKVSESTKVMSAFSTITGALTSPVGIATTAIAGLGAVAVLAYKEFTKLSEEEEFLIKRQQELSDATTRSYQRIQEETETLVDNYENASNDVKASLDNMVDVTVTEEKLNDLKGKFEASGTALEEVATRNSNNLFEIMSKAYMLDGVIDTEEQKSLDAIRQHGEDKKEEVQGTQNKIYEILELAYLEQRELTEEELDKILGLQEKQDKLLLETVEKNSGEFLALQQNIKYGRVELTKETFDESMEIIERGLSDEKALIDDSYTQNLIELNSFYQSKENEIDKNDTKALEALRKQKEIEEKTLSDNYQSQLDSLYQHKDDELKSLEEGIADKVKLEEQYRKEIQELTELSNVAQGAEMYRAADEAVKKQEEYNQLGLKKYKEYYDLLEEEREKNRKEAGLDATKLGEIGTEAAENYTGNMKDGVEKGSVPVTTAFKNLVDFAKEELERRKEEFEDIGNQFGEGVAQGVEMTIGEVAAAAAKMAASALQSMRSELDIHSPSRKAKEIFAYVGQGAVLGLEDEEKNIQKAAIAFSNTALGNLGGKAEFSSGSAPRSSHTTGTTEIKVSIYANDLGDPFEREDIGKDIGRKIENRCREQGILST